MSQNTSEKLLAFIKSSPDCFHAVQTMKEQLLAQNFTELSEEEHWNLAYGGQYFVTRNGSSIIAFTRSSGVPVPYPKYRAPSM